MKKLIMIAVALFVLAVPNVVYAEAEIVYEVEKKEIVFDSELYYDVYIDGVEQNYDALLADWELYLPIKKMYKEFGASSIVSADGTIETLVLGNETLEINKAEEEIVIKGNGPVIVIGCGEYDGVLYITSYDYQHKMKNLIIPVEDKKAVHILTMEGTEKKLGERNELFKAQSPGLYSAFENMITLPYSFNYNINTNVVMTPVTEEAAAALPVRKLFLNIKTNGYVNLIKENLEATFNMTMDAGPAFQESIEGAKVMLMRNMFYLYDPQWDDWDSEEILDSKKFDEAKAILSDSNNASAWLLVDHLTETSSTDGTVTYKAVIKGDELKEAIDAVTFDGYYQMMLDVFEEERTLITIEEIEFLYVIKDGKMTAQHIEVDLDMSVEGVEMDLNISGDGTFYSYGLVKELVLPREFRPSLQPK